MKRFNGFRLLAGTVAVLTFTVFGTSAMADSLSSLENQYSTLQQKQKQLQQQASSQNSQLKTEQQKMDNLNQTVKVTISQISVLNQQISVLNTQISQKAADITATQNRIDQNKELYKERLRAMYESGNMSYLQVLLSSNNINEFLTKTQMLKTISAYDDNLISALETDESRLQADQASLQTSMSTLQNKKSTLTAQKNAVSTQLSKQGQMVSQMKQSLNTTKQQQAEIDKEINTVIAQEAAEKARQLAGQPKGSVSANTVIAYAERLLGSRYVFDTAGPNTFDCSGFTQYVFANSAGIALTHSAAGQAGYGTAVSKSNLAPGDLVFFDTEGGISHVGIYIGNDRFIAANSERTGVSESSLFSSSYWGPRYVCARRILK